MSTDDPTAARRFRYAHDALNGHQVPSWIAAGLAEVPRHLFLRYCFHPVAGGEGLWAAYSANNLLHQAVSYTNASWPIQLDGDSTRWETAWEQAVAGTATAECVKPELLGLMLAALDPDDDTVVLQAPTGSGYGVALLAYRLGGDQVTSLDVDTTLSDQARTALRDSGYVPTLLVSDDVTHGWPRRGLYDRILATCAVPTIPRPWIDQTRPGGIIVAGLWRGTACQPVVALTVNVDGTAEGRLLRHTSTLLPVPCSQHISAGREPVPGNPAASYGTPGRLRRTPEGTTNNDFATFTTLALAGVEAHRDPITGAFWYVTGSGAARIDGEARTLTEYSCDGFADQILHSFDSWCRVGAPTADRFGLTVTADGRHDPWLDSPNRPLWTVVEG